ncbi:MAG: UPF0280 family protein [Eubacteriales bacterium]|nr:UPF0280 family protein [Eubacteriales bacterium]
MTPYSDYSNRNEYRKTITSDLICWCTQFKETELYICAGKPYKNEAYAAVLSLRGVLDDYIKKNKVFAESFSPVDAAPDAHPVVARMCDAAKAAGVGPMAAVAGAFAAHVGREILRYTGQVIVENGGDIFIKADAPKTVAIYAGHSSLSMKIGITVDARDMAVAVCTSSGTIGHSVSFGKADAAVVVSHDACLADACATRLGNEIIGKADMQKALDMIAGIGGVIGAMAVVDDQCGAVGSIQLQTL